MFIKRIQLVLLVVMLGGWTHAANQEKKLHKYMAVGVPCESESGMLQKARLALMFRDSPERLEELQVQCKKQLQGQQSELSLGWEGVEEEYNKQCDAYREQQIGSKEQHRTIEEIVESRNARYKKMQSVTMIAGFSQSASSYRSSDLVGSRELRPRTTTLPTLDRVAQIKAVQKKQREDFDREQQEVRLASAQMIVTKTEEALAFAKARKQYLLTNPDY